MASGGPRLIVKFGHVSDKECQCVRIGTNPGLSGRNKGRKRVERRNSSVVVSWDFSKATFIEGSPEPVGGYYVTVSVDSELGLPLVDQGRACESSSVTYVLVSQREELFADELYSTEARFCPNGELHNILMKCGRAEQETEEGNDQRRPRSMLRVSVDKKLAVRVKRLQWDFRGSQTISVDGSAVDFMWNVHDRFHNVGTEPGVFMFRTRRENGDG